MPGSVCQLELVNVQKPGLQKTSFDLGKTLLGTIYEYGLQLIKLLVIKNKSSVRRLLNLGGSDCCKSILKTEIERPFVH